MDPEATGGVEGLLGRRCRRGPLGPERLDRAVARGRPRQDRAGLPALAAIQRGQRERQVPELLGGIGQGRVARCQRLNRLVELGARRGRGEHGLGGRVLPARRRGSARAPTPATAVMATHVRRTIPACSLMNPFRSRTAVTILSCVVAGNAKLRLALAQVNPTVGAVAENAALISAWLERARDGGADPVLFPELSLPGYPAEDLYLKRHFLQANAAALDELAGQVRGIAAMVGFAEPRVASGDLHPFDAPAPRAAHNALALLRDSRVEAVYRKQRLPNYAVFDEQRYFEPGTEPLVVELAGTQVGLTICEDVWEPGPPASVEADRGAELIVCPSGSPVLPRQARRPLGDVR